MVDKEELGAWSQKAVSSGFSFITLWTWAHLIYLSCKIGRTYTSIADIMEK